MSGCNYLSFASEHLRASEYMPAPGPKDGHASKASRDLQLTRGTSAKSNGFKYGGGTLDGANSASVRTGISNSLRDQLSRKKLQTKFLERKRKREEEAEADEREKNDFRRRNGPNEEEKRDDDDEEEENKNTNKKRRVDQTDSERLEKEEEEKEEKDAVTSNVKDKIKNDVITFPWTCDICERKVMQSEHQRNDHLNSKKHKKNAEKKRGRELLRRMLAEKR